MFRGQSLQYHHEMEIHYAQHAGFEEIIVSMNKLINQGKIRGYGFCNDNCYGLTATSQLAKSLGLVGPVVMQNDFSLIDRRAGIE